MSAIDDLARRLARLEKQQLAASSPQLAYSSIENGALRAHDDELGETMQIGLQWDGTYAPTVITGPVPPTPSYPVVQDGIGGFVAIWDGTFEGGAVPPMDFLRVDVHIGVSSDFVPDHNNRFGSISAPTGGSLTIGAAAGTYYVKLVAWTLAGKVSGSTIGVVAHSEAAEVGTDGSAPASSPTPEALSGIEAIFVRWIPITNPDPVTYEVHISLTSGFTPDGTTKAGETQGSIFTIKAMPGAAPVNPGDPDPRAFQYDTVYYIKIIAKDDDGPAAPSAQTTGNVIQIPAGSLAADVVTAREVVAGSFTGDEFAGSVAIFSDFKTSETGQRLWWGVSGIQQFRSDNTRRFYVPPTDEEDIFIDAQVKARGLQVTGGASFEGTQNSIEKDGALRLASGVSSSSIAPPQMGVYYDTVKLDSGGSKTGAVGTFAFNATEVNCITWNPVGLFNAYQYKANIGSRVWRFNLDGTYNSHSDFADYEITGETWLPGDSDGYMMFRYIPAGQQYYVTHGNLFNTYSRQDGNRIPSIGNNGVNIFSVETISATGQLRINIRTAMNATNYGAFPAPSSTINSATTRNYQAVRPTALFGNFPSGAGGNRFAASETGGTANIQMFNAAGTWLDDDFEAPGPTKRGILYDGANFWTLGQDGYLYRHSNFTWGAATTSVLWGRLTLRDSNPTGGTHETTPGPFSSFTMKRRANVRIFYPDLPFAGTGNPDDPDRWVFYAGRSLSQPANTALWQQGEAVDGVSSQIYSALATSGTNPPTTNNFPGATPGEIRNDALTLRIKGDGSGLFSSLSVAGTAVSVNPPTQQRFTSSGTWSKPAGCKAVRVISVGGGGAGAGSTAAASGENSKGGGGGSGGTAEKLFLASDLASSVAVSVGGGGVGAVGTASAAAASGGNSSFQHTTPVVGNGGAGGICAGSSASAGFAGAGGSGGSASGGDLNISGNAGIAGTGSALLAGSGSGGGSTRGGGGAARSTGSVGASLSGFAGGAYGGGGGGALSTSTGAAAVGGSGAAGIVIVECYF